MTMMALFLKSIGIGDNIPEFTRNKINTKILSIAHPYIYVK